MVSGFGSRSRKAALAGGIPTIIVVGFAEDPEPEIQMLRDARFHLQAGAIADHVPPGHAVGIAHQNMVRRIEILEGVGVAVATGPGLPITSIRAAVAGSIVELHAEARLPRQLLKGQSAFKGHGLRIDVEPIRALPKGHRSRLPIGLGCSIEHALTIRDTPPQCMTLLPRGMRRRPIIGGGDRRRESPI